MTTPVQPKCSLRDCRHFRGMRQHDRKDPLSLFWVCKAFPRWPGIPTDISYGNNLHLEPYPDDHGIRLEPKKKKGGRKL
jgi:hypothetical protein